MKIKDWQKEIYKNAKNKGFWEKKSMDQIPGKIALIHAEVSEALEAYRDISKKSQLKKVLYDDKKPDGFAIEVADIIIRCLDLAEFCEIDIEKMMDLKHKFNLTRPWKHNRKI